MLLKKNHPQPLSPTQSWTFFLRFNLPQSKSKEKKKCGPKVGTREGTTAPNATFSSQPGLGSEPHHALFSLFLGTAGPPPLPPEHHLQPRLGVSATSLAVVSWPSLFLLSLATLPSLLGQPGKTKLRKDPICDAPRQMGDMYHGLAFATSNTKTRLGPAWVCLGGGI